MGPIRPIALSTQCPSGGPSPHRGPPWAIRAPPARIIAPNVHQVPTVADIGPHRPHIEPISYHCVLHLHTEPPSLQGVRGLVSNTLPIFWCYAFLCLNLILQPYMVAEAYWFWKMHHSLLTRPEIHLGSPKPTDVPPPEGPDRPPPDSISRMPRPSVKNFAATWGTA